MKFLIKRIFFHKRHFKIKYNVHRKTILNHKTTLEGYNNIGINSNIKNSSLGYGSYIGNNCYLPHTKIGRYCSIASNVSVIIGTHPTNKFVSSHPSFFSTRKQAGFSFVDKEKFNEIKWVSQNLIIDIANDVWIGNDVKIIQGLRIGNGAIIATGSVVVKDIEPYAIYGGIPAKFIKSRFDDEDVNFLIKIQWWNWKIEKIKKYASYFDDIKIFKNIWTNLK